ITASLMVERHRVIGSSALVVSLALLAATDLTSRGLYVRYPKGIPLPDEQPTYERWSSLSHVTLSRFGWTPFPLWSVGRNVKPYNVNVALALIDGDAATHVYEYGDGVIEHLALLKSDATATAHVLRPNG